METDEDIKLEFGGDTEPGASTGWRSATSIPRFTRNELEKGLDTDVNDQIEELFHLITSLTSAVQPAPESEEPQSEKPDPEPDPGEHPSP